MLGNWYYMSARYNFVLFQRCMHAGLCNSEAIVNWVTVSAQTDLSMMKKRAHKSVNYEPLFPNSSRLFRVNHTSTNADPTTWCSHTWLSCRKLYPFFSLHHESCTVNCCLSLHPQIPRREKKNVSNYCSFSWFALVMILCRRQTVQVQLC